MIVSRSYKSMLAIAMLAAVCTACSTTTGTSSVPNAGAGANSVHSSSIAPQAKQMLALRHGGPAIGAHVGIARLFAPVHPSVGTTVLYNSIVRYGPKNMPGDNLSSEGFECCQVNEFGDAVSLTQTDTVTKVSVVMQSWGCQSGFWFANNCSTTRGAKFAEPITLSMYRVQYDTTMGPPEPGLLILRQTKTFNINYRPSASPRCVGTSYTQGGFIGKPDGYCDQGVSQVINFNVARPITSLPSQVIVTVAYNTSDSGYNPYGQNTPCFTGPGGCGYDSLNVAADGNGGVDNSQGSAIDPNGVQIDYSNTSNYTNFGCTTYNSNYTLQDSSPCWTGYHPDITIIGT